MCWSLINIYAFKWFIWIPFAEFYGYLLSLYRLKIYYEVYTLFLEYIPLCEELPIELYHIFFNSGNSSYHFKLMGCSSLPWPHRYRHKGQNEPVTKVTTIHFTLERSSPPVPLGLCCQIVFKIWFRFCAATDAVILVGCLRWSINIWVIHNNGIIPQLI